LPHQNHSQYFSFDRAAGYAFAFGGQNDSTATSFIGTTSFASVGDSPAFWFFQYTFSATSVTIVAGTLAERCQMAGTCRLFLHRCFRWERKALTVLAV
jgi:ammonia channel protein AmtB